MNPKRLLVSQIVTAAKAVIRVAEFWIRADDRT